MFSKSQEKLFNKNRKILVKYFPNMAPLIDADIPENVKIVLNDEIDVEINGTKFYGVDAKIYVQKQLDFFIQNPNIIEIAPVTPDKDRTPFHLNSLSRFDKMFRRRIKAAAVQRLRLDAATTFIFGIGLGFHLYPLIADTRCREIILVEPEPVFLILSMYFTDWTKIIKTLKGRVSFVIDRDPDSCFSTIRGHIHLRNPGVQQTIYHFQHYKAGIIDAIHRNFVKKSYIFFDGLGFFDDEKNMTKNFVNNIYNDVWAVCADRLKPVQGTAVVVGAGPSLDADIQWLKDNQKNIFVFSGGSSLQPLLKNGIIPDFHAEIENIAMNYDLLKPLVESGSLDDTYLICSSTMDARAARLFKKRIWFMREGVMCTYLYDGSPAALCWQNPTVVNTGLSAALHLGFRDIILLGADFGTLDPVRHHASGSAYETFSELKAAEFKFPIPVSGNFVSNAYTNSHYQSGINCVKFILREFRGAKVYNASNGVKIASVPPIRSGRVKIHDLNGHKQNIVEAVAQSVSEISWLDIVGDDLFGDLKKEFKEYINEIRGIIKISRRKNKDFILFLSDCFMKINSISTQSSRFNPMITGSFVTETIMLVHWWRRILDQDLKKYERMSYDFLLDWLAEAEGEFSEFIDKLRQELPLVRPELFDDKGSLIVEAKPSVQNAE